jgi:hypothetical protein
MNQRRFKHELVNSIPEKLQSNILYVTRDKDVAAHLCACGCGREVITPLSPTDWSIKLQRDEATLLPSIGNWAFPCRSHYFIRNGAVVWASNMSNQAVALGRQRDRARKRSYYEQQGKTRQPTQDNAFHASDKRKSAWQRLVDWWQQLVR